MSKTDNTDEQNLEGKTLRRAFSGSIIKGINEAKREIDFVISTASIDRYGDTIQQNGWVLKHYRKNPVVLFGHESRVPPIGRATKVWKDDEALMATSRFMGEDVSPFADSIYQMYLQKFLNAVSVGFKPLEYEWIQDEDGKHTGGLNFVKQDLLEFSAVPIPANPEALVAARRKGINTTPIKDWAEIVLDDWPNSHKMLEDMFSDTHKGLASRNHIEQVRRRAAGVGTTFILPPDQQDELLMKNFKSILNQKKNLASKSKEKSNFEILDETFELPILTEEALKDVGTVECTTEEINGVKGFVVDKADDTIQIASDFLFNATEKDNDDEDDSFVKGLTVETKDNKGKKELHFTINDTNKEYGYQILGFTDDGCLKLMAVKTFEKDVTSEEASEAEAEVEAESEVDATVQEAETETETEEAETETETESEDESATEEVEAEAEGKSVKTEKTEKQGEPSFQDSLTEIERSLMGLESHISKGVKVDKIHDVRRAKFIASYLRDIADALDGGENKETVKQEKGTSQAVSPVIKTKDTSVGFTESELAEALKEAMAGVKPLIESTVKQKLSEKRGRLD